jgi:glucose-6-phosphate 1-dehydrogenase
MDFCYDTSFDDNSGHPDAYERVLMDAFSGDSTLFTTADEALASWHIIENVIHEWSKDSIPLHVYDKGSWGPDAAAEFAKSTGSPWLSENIMMCPVDSRALRR